MRELYQPTIVMSMAAGAWLRTPVRMVPCCCADADSLLEFAVSRKEPWMAGSLTDESRCDEH
jgi:hypothetical protein